VLPPDMAKLLPKNRLLTEAEWRGLGVQQSRGWVHYGKQRQTTPTLDTINKPRDELTTQPKLKTAIHRPEPHIMLFRRTLNYGQAQA